MPSSLADAVPSLNAKLTRTPRRLAASRHTRNGAILDLNAFREAKERQRATTQFFRLVHSSGELTFRDRNKACAALRQRPGAKLFVERDCASCRS